MKEITEMTKILLKISTDSYQQCKYMFLAASRESPNVKAFFELLFEMTDRKRPLLIQMKKGGVE